MLWHVDFGLLREGELEMCKLEITKGALYKYEMILGDSMDWAIALTDKQGS